MTDRIPAQCFHPGEYIRDEMEARKWDVVELARRMSVHDMPVEIAVSLIECKQAITPSIAFGLCRAFGTSADLWMNLQKAFDVWQESRLTQRAADGAKAGSEKTVVAKFSKGKLVSERVISPRS